ncbi:hypothetical protein [Kitasatospora cinereorecta]|uniref:Uncharacterized protein n=1 Tax=Kitasatospora cinereorecta TaxID=285560 RepID=A0ABW0VPT4_9ACTN
MLQKKLILAADDPAKIANILAQNAKTPAPHNRNITDEMMVVIIARVAAGNTLTAVCRELEVSADLVRKRGRDHPEKWGRELEEAEIQMAHAMYERRLDIVFDMSIDTARAKLISETLRDQAVVSNRRKYGDKVQVETQRINYIMPADLDALFSRPEPETVDAEFTVIDPEKE